MSSSYYKDLKHSSKQVVPITYTLELIILKLYEWFEKKLQDEKKIYI